MKKIMLIVGGLGLASGFALAQDEHPTATSTDPMSQSSESTAEYGDDSMAQGLDGMTAEELEGQKVETLTGEEIGEINEVGTVTGSTDRVATVDVGGFLGVGEKTIVIPLSELEKSVSDDDTVRTSMTRETIESQPEFDDSTFTADEEE